MNWFRFFIIILIVGIFCSYLLGGFAIMAFANLSHLDYEGLKETLYCGLLFPSVFISGIVFFVLMRKYKRLCVGTLAFLIPIGVMLSVSFYLRYGNLSYQYLPDVDSRHFRGTPAFNLVDDILQNKDVETVDKDALDCITYNGMTPLLYFIHYRLYDKADILLSLGANPNKQNSMTGLSPLCELLQSKGEVQYITAEGDKLFETLVQNGADVNLVCNNQSPLMYLCSQQEVDIEKIALLLNSGADVNYRYRQEDKYLHDCYQENECALNMLVYSGQYSAALYLIEQGADTTGYRDWMLDQLSRNQNKSEIEVDGMREIQLMSILKSCE